MNKHLDELMADLALIKEMIDKKDYLYSNSKKLCEKYGFYTRDNLDYFDDILNKIRIEIAMARGE